MVVRGRGCVGEEMVGGVVGVGEVLSGVRVVWGREGGKKAGMPGIAGAKAAAAAASPPVI